MGKICS